MFILLSFVITIICIIIILLWLWIFHLIWNRIATDKDDSINITFVIGLHNHKK